MTLTGTRVTKTGRTPIQGAALWWETTLMPSIPLSLDTYLPREKVPDALERELGLHTTKTSLATMATRGGGPRFRKFGPRAVYRWGDVVEWAEAKLSASRRSTAEGYVLDNAEPRKPTRKRAATAEHPATAAE
jgi:hypothetical protein